MGRATLDPRFVAIFRNELLRLVRDRRALFLAVVLPMLLYPAYFLGAQALGREAERRMDAQELLVLADLEALEVELFGAVNEALDGIENLTVRYHAFEAPDAPEAWGVEDLETAFVEAGAWDPDASAPDAPDGTRAPDGWLVAVPAEAADAGTGDAPAANDGNGPPARPRLELWYDGSNERAQELSGRLRTAIWDLSDTWVDAELERRLPLDPALVLGATAVDRAEAIDAAGANFGRFLAVVTVMILVSGGAYAALDAFAAEREQGTLETLLVQPVPVRVVGWAKFAAVAVSASVALLGNLGSLVGSAAAGIVPTGVEGGAGADLLGATFAGRLALALALGAPGGLLVVAVLCALSARARTYREAQTMILPVTLAALALTAPATLPGVELVPTIAAIPLVGSSLAMRDALAGHLTPLAGLLSVIASGVAAWFALRKVGALLDLESVLQHGDTEAEGDLRQRRARRALAVGWLSVFAIYFVGSWWQSQSLTWGLAGTLWILAVGLALLLARLEAKDRGGSLLEPLGLTRPGGAGAWASVPVAVLGLAGLAGILLAWQEQVLPLPPGFGGEVTGLIELGPWLGLFLLAVTPGVCEELLFRGSVQSGLMRDWSPRKAILWQAALFALAHASIHRLLPTFTIGLFLGFLRWRSGSVLPGMVVHALYNGVIVASAAPWFDRELRKDLSIAENPWLAALLLAALPLAWGRARSGRDAVAPAHTT